MTFRFEKSDEVPATLRTASSILEDERGSVIIYVSIIITVLIGLVGMAIDFSRYYNSHSEAQSAADAAALAAASQLDGSLSAITRATNAAMTTPLVSNTQTFATGADAGGTVAISSIRFLTNLPADDASPITAGFVTTDPIAARFVEVTTEPLVHNNMFLIAVGVAGSGTFSATAVAGMTSVICDITPLMICNPAEADPPDGLGVGASFNPDDWRGRQIVAKQSGPDSTWGPGIFGLLDVPDVGQGAKEVAEMLASLIPPSQCYTTKVDIRPGSVASVRTSFNTRFDMYENPHFGGASSSNPLYRPARNVTKGRRWIGSGANVCGDADEPGPPVATGFGRDTNIVDDPSGPQSGPRFGNGEWDCLEYWSVNHPVDVIPAGCDVPALNTWTRHKIYTYENTNNLIPDNLVDPANPIGSGEDGNPQCYGGDPAEISDNPPRRILYLAIVNCREQAINGNEDNVPTIAFMKTFLTEPVGSESANGANDSDVLLEVVDIVRPGSDSGTLHDIIQIYR